MSADPLSALFAAPNGAAAGGTGDDLDALFAGGFGPLPPGEYNVELISGRLGQSRGGTRRYELRAKIVEGEHAGKALFDDWYLTPAAMWKSGPFLKALGITTAEQLHIGVARGACRAGIGFLLCTDGLTEGLDDAALARLVQRTDLAAQECVDHLLLDGLEASGSDNLTVILVRLS